MHVQIVNVCLMTIGHLISIIHGYNLDTLHPIIFKSAPGNYFGYTVALHRNRNGAMAMIGAPRANSSVLGDQLFQPGALYQCNMRASCAEVVLDKKGNTQTDNGIDDAYYDKKDSMWLGVSLDILQNMPQNNIVTCGHLWKNQFYRQHYLANGACYVINSELDSNSARKLVPFVEKSKQAIIPPGIYYYAFGQVGTSAAFSEDGNYLHLGAPGFYDWTGTVVSYNLSSGNIHQEYRRPYVPDPPTDQNLTPESYIGYSVTSGKFYDNNEDYVAVGAPRDGGFCGRVYIFKVTSNKKMSVHQRKNGLQLGEYFGATVLAMNLNGDDYTDLLVGAPLYSSENGVDEGKVYVYISNGLGLQNFAELYGKNKVYARFGTAIANLGDLNQDGYNDVAVGAPYEDEKGVIYIYHGSPSGINVQYVQRIAAKDIDSSLSGFGIHISRGFDVDLNQYPDVLVGAYASSKAVLFKSLPVIQLSATLSFSPQQINTNMTNCVYQGEKVPCVNVTACLWYVGKHVPLRLEFQNNIYVEHPIQGNFISNRGFFFQNGKATSVMQRKSQLEIGIDNCVTEELYIRPDVKDVITPVQVLYRYNLIRNVRNDTFQNFPVIDPLSSSNITSSISFLTGCGSNDKCLSDLAVTVKILGHPDKSHLIIGKNSTLSLAIEVVNNGEPAYLAELLITLPPELPSINQDICSAVQESQNQRSNASLLCDLGNPLQSNQKVKILIKLDLTKVPTNKKQVFIGLEARTASTEVNPLDNIAQLPLNFKAVADISITGTPTHEQIPYEEKLEESLLPVSITHTYFVMNHGPSPIDIIDIVLYIPVSIHGANGIETFVTFTNLEADSGKPLTIPAKCNDSNLVIKPVSPEVKTKIDVFGEEELVSNDKKDNSSSLFDVFRDYDSVEAKSTSNTRTRRNAVKQSSKRKNDVILNCETTDCIAIECSASPFSDTRKFAKITVTVLVNVSLLNKFYDPWYRIEYITSGEVSMRKDGSNLYLKQHHPDGTEVKTVIIHSGPVAHEEVAQWIIFVSIGVGVLLLLIILILLIKFGFFRREQKEKMEKMKTKDDLNEYDPCADESAECEALN